MYLKYSLGNHYYYIQMLITIGWIQDIVAISYIAWAGMCMCVWGGWGWVRGGVARERSRPTVCH